MTPDEPVYLSYDYRALIIDEPPIDAQEFVAASPKRMLKVGAPNLLPPPGAVITAPLPVMSEVLMPEWEPPETEDGEEEEPVEAGRLIE